MIYKLFIDDIRNPADVGLNNAEWLTVKSSEEAKKVVGCLGMPKTISFDHDLGGSDTTMDFLKWLTDACQDNKLRFPKNFAFGVHSTNPVGAENIRGLMRNLINHFTA